MILRHEPTYFTVRIPRGGSFPIDMLRYDDAYPVGTVDAVLIETLIRRDDAAILKLPKMVDIRLASRSSFAPCVDRWNSFMVEVVQEETT